MDIYVIPDTQIKPNIDTTYLNSIAQHIAKEKPAYVIQMGDWHDMPSCSYYDKGKKSHEVYNFIEDIESGNDADYYFFECLNKYWPRHNKKCKKVKLLGNHEDRIKRAHEYGDPNLREIIKRYKIDNSRWDRVIPFLRTIKIEGCYFSHYFPNDNSGKPIGTARQLINKRHKTCIAGHMQGFDYAEQLTVGEKTIHGLIAGSCYLHAEEYKGPNNHHFRGVVVLRNVKNGMFDIERHGLKNLMTKYK